MLKTLAIENLALIDHAEFEFERGLICFTGETGAGKSVFLSALKLLSGQRCERIALRPGTNTGKVEGLFQFEDPLLKEINAVLESFDLPVCEEGTLLLRRNFGERQKISINGALSTLAALKTLGKFWLEFHTPNEPQRLFEGKTQLELLDRFAAIMDLKAEYGKQYKIYKEILARIEEIRSHSGLSPNEIEYLQQQKLEFQKLELSEAFITQLEHDFKKLSQKEDCLQLLQNIQHIFNETPGLFSSLDCLQGYLDSLASKWEQAKTLLQQCQQVRIELQDIENTCEEEQSSFDFDPEQCLSIQQNMQTWLELQRHYGSSLQQIQAAYQSLLFELDAVEHSAEQLQQAELDLKKQEHICRELSDQLHQKRILCIPKLTQMILACLQSLGFVHPLFEIALNSAEKLTDTGCDTVCFKFASDKALPCAPLDRVASSGELSRILLALKSVLHDTHLVPVLVFDEIDANVGGEIGSKVGALLKNLGQQAQVFCVTHLPQVAGQAHYHYCVEKDTKADYPTIRFSFLENAEIRYKELARMLGDANSTSALDHAKTLLK